MLISKEEGKELALKSLAERRETNKSIIRIDNQTLCAGPPTHFYCIGCGAEIAAADGYHHKSEFCPDCDALRILGWLPDAT